MHEISRMTRQHLTIGNFQIFNHFGYAYEIDARGIYSFNGFAWDFAIDDRLWPIYRPDEYPNEKNVKKDNTFVFWPGDLEIIVGYIPNYFQMIDGKIRIARVKNAAIDYIDDAQKRADFVEVVKWRERVYDRIDEGYTYLLVIDNNQLYTTSFGLEFGVRVETDVRKIKYSKINSDFFLQAVDGVYLEDIMYIGLTSVYPLKVMNARSRTVEQKKMKIDSGPESSQWWEKLQNFISRDFQDDVMYFQVDYNGILQTFHCRPTKHPNDAPLRMTFTGDAYD
jgi:hypothetical protein